MLMGLCEVNREGEFTVIGDPRVLYSVMMAIRMQIVSSAGLVTMWSTQTAIRYCCVRRQFSTIQGSRDERKVIDYQTTSFTLGRLLSRGIVLALAGEWVVKEYTALMQDVEREVFDKLDQNHHILAGFKASFSEQCLINIEEARRSTGGAGYQANSGFVTLWSIFSPNDTLEGQNTVMLGQATRYLIKLYRRA